MTKKEPPQPEGCRPTRRHQAVHIQAGQEQDTESVLLEQLLEARQRSGLTQAEVAVKMGTKPPAVTRLEAALSDQRHSPTLATLKKYAHAVGCKLEVNLVPGNNTIPRRSSDSPCAFEHNR